MRTTVPRALSWKWLIRGSVVLAIALACGFGLQAQDTPTNFFGWYYASGDKYGSCVDAQGAAYTTKEDGDKRCDSTGKGSCLKHYNTNLESTEVTVGQCVYCGGPDSGDWSGTEPLPHDNNKSISAAKIISLKAYGSCTSTGASSGQKCVNCPYFFCAKVRMYFGACNDKCDATDSEVYAFAASSSCDPSATP